MQLNRKYHMDLKRFEIKKNIQKTDDKNLRSRKAIEKIGGQFEGILRHDMLRDNNTKRNSAYYSITDEEWPDQKIKLTALILPT